VLTVTTTPERRDSLRRLTGSVGVDQRHPDPWRGFLFAAADDIPLDKPRAAVERVWYRAGAETEPYSLLE
jgi:hypothetical protein